MNCVELFCGSGTISKVFESAGWFTLSVDIRKRKGVCEPDLRKSILQLSRLELPERVHVLWASPPCDVWSYASGSFHWNDDGSPKTEKSQAHIMILERLMDLIDEINPDIFFIENPRGRLRFYKPFTDWLLKHHAVAKTITLSSYGFQTTKPTNIFTNAIDWIPKDMDPFGRGAKVEVLFDNMTVCNRQKTPEPLAQEILAYCNKKLSN